MRRSAPVCRAPQFPEPAPPPGDHGPRRVHSYRSPNNPRRLTPALLALALLPAIGLPAHADGTLPPAQVPVPADSPPIPARVRAARGDALRADGRHAEALAEYLA